MHDFVEKHGKGEVGVFSHVGQWIKRGLAEKKVLIDNISDLLECLRMGAKTDMELKPQPVGPAYHIEMFDSKQKPREYNTLGAQQLSIAKTYCLELTPHQPSSSCSVRNRFFSTSPFKSCVHLRGVV